jgi:hypothetical protein
MRRRHRALRLFLCGGFLLTLFGARLAAGQELSAPGVWAALNQGDHLADGFEHLDGREAMVAYAESAVAAQPLVERVGRTSAASCRCSAVVTRSTRR